LSRLGVDPECLLGQALGVNPLIDSLSTSKMLLNFLYEALTFFTAPRKQYCLAVQAEQIRHNRQPPPLNLTMFKTKPNTIVQEPVEKEVTGAKDTGFPEPLSPCELARFWARDNKD